MSGIVAAHGPFDPRMGERMLQRLAHRGPDGEGSKALPDAWLGHRHLAVVDPEAAQPLHDPAGRMWLVGDGFVSNHRRLREELGDDGWRTRSDHEVALRLFAQEGVDGLDRLWGTFALAIAGDDGSFAVVRDTLGVVPLYWARRDATTLFASELKAFDEDWRPYVEPFPPGHAWTAADGLHAWRRPPASARVLLRGRAHDDPPAWVFDAVRDAVVRAVDQAMVAQVPVGAFLSGGLDSSIVAAVAAQRSKEPLKTFAAGLQDSADLQAARLVAEHVGTDHRERVYTPEEAIDLVPEVIGVLESFDPLLVHSAVPNHLVAKLASEHVKVVLIGEGADELFAGYSHLSEIEDSDELQQELLDTLSGLHIGGLQRVDRVMSANGLEPRIPFLDLDVVDLAFALPPAWKLSDGDRPEKWLLRRAFEGWLPDEVLWRPKEQFGQGTGMDVVLREHFGAQVTEEDLERERDVLDPPVRTREELAYHRIFARHLPGIDANRTVGRFVEA